MTIAGERPASAAATVTDMAVFRESIDGRDARRPLLRSPARCAEAAHEVAKRRRSGANGCRARRL
jgi:hypothetical protein